MASSIQKKSGILKEENKTLTKMLHIFEEQLRRLKVEEMALLSTIKNESMKEAAAQGDQVDENTSCLVNLFQDASDINKESLNLQVASTYDNGRLGEFMENGDFEEEEDEERDEVEKDDQEEDEMDEEIKDDSSVMLKYYML
ncbi:nucleomorphin [Biomphalaria pfeifferi]|uniref:Nucleomorphin n=1 Tax=Biomphalaria pfeifferi TaxID=112525 RepID=A0AAD8ASP5_BIOPF|nr:nucleomorphin [Biomphalaria pfeifferi]